MRVEQADCCRVQWEIDAAGKPVKMIEIPGSDFSLKADLVLLAMGFLHVEKSRLLNDLGVEYDRRGNITVDENYSTGIPGVFAAGDATTGASLVVRAIFHGLEAARAVGEYLRG